MRKWFSALLLFFCWSVHAHSIPKYFARLFLFNPQHTNRPSLTRAHHFNVIAHICRAARIMRIYVYSKFISKKHQRDRCVCVCARVDAPFKRQYLYCVNLPPFFLYICTVHASYYYMIIMIMMMWWLYSAQDLFASFLIICVIHIKRTNIALRVFIVTHI